MSAALNVIGSVFGNNFLVFSFQLGHYGITPEEDEFRAWINPAGIWNFYKYNDHCGYDMTLRGAAELNEKIRLAPNTYYYSYTTANTKEGNIIKCQLPDEGLSPIFYISSMMLSSTKGTKTAQVSLFDVQESKVETEIKALNVDTLTPLQALTILTDINKRLNGND
jgi:hypothetical protein